MTFTKVILNLKNANNDIYFYWVSSETHFFHFMQMQSWSSEQDAKQATHTEERVQPVPTHAHIQRMIPNCTMPRMGISAFNKFVKKLINCQKSISVMTANRI